MPIRVPIGFSTQTMCLLLVLFIISAPYIFTAASHGYSSIPPEMHGMTMPGEMSLPFDNSYGRLPDRFYARLAPTPVSAPRLVKLNRPLALQLGLDPERLASPEGVEILAGNRVPEGSEPIALAYAGHQFG